MNVFLDSSSGQVGSVVCSLTKKEIDGQFYTMMDICYKHQGKFPETAENRPADVKCLGFCSCNNGDVSRLTMHYLFVLESCVTDVTSFSVHCII